MCARVSTEEKERREGDDQLKRQVVYGASVYVKECNLGVPSGSRVRSVGLLKGAFKGGECLSSLLVDGYLAVGPVGLTATLAGLFDSGSHSGERGHRRPEGRA